MPKMEYRPALNEDGEAVEKPFPVSYAPMCCIICADVVGGEFKDLEKHYSDQHLKTPLQTFPCSYCKQPKKTATKRNQHERRCKDKPAGVRLIP